MFKKKEVIELWKILPNSLKEKNGFYSHIIFKGHCITNQFYSIIAYNLKSQKSKLVLGSQGTKFIYLFSILSENRFVSLTNYNGQLYVFDENLEFVDQKKFDCGECFDIVSPTDNMLCFLDKNYIYLYDYLNDKFLSKIPHFIVKVPIQCNYDFGQILKL